MQLNNYLVKRAAYLVCSLTFVSQSVNAAWCPPYLNETVQPMFTSSEQVFDQAVTAMDTALSLQLQQGSERTTSAIAVLTQQLAVGANQQVLSNRNASQQYANGMNAVRIAEAQKNAILDFSGLTGQGFDACAVIENRYQTAIRASDARADVATRATSEVKGGAGRMNTDPGATLKDIIDSNAAYCTQDLVDSGLCDAVGSMPGLSTNVAVLFTPAKEGEDVFQAKNDFINNVVGAAPLAPAEASAGTVVTQQYINKKIARDAQVSVAATALKAVQMDHSEFVGGETGSGKSPHELINNEVGRYAGAGADYVRWNASVAAQSKRGLLVELLKIKALDLYLQSKQYEQNEKIEALLASVVAQRTKNLSAAQEAKARHVKVIKESVVKAAED